MTRLTQKALLVIDLQKDYFPGGAYPLWNTGETLKKIEMAIAKARAQGVHVIHIQHIANTSKGIAPFFNKDTAGAAIHPRILAAAPDAPIVIKDRADSFYETELAAVLSQLGVSELLLCGMMTQNCVTHTAISRAAEAYSVAIIADCCTTVDEMIHLIALNAVSTRVPLLTLDQAL
jgi:nicotinamidase-related amidase